MIIDVVPSNRKNKKWKVEFLHHTPVHIGQRGASDYTIHHDEKRKQNYINRHKKNEDWSNPYSAGALSRYLLWTYKDLDTAIKEYNKRFFLLNKRT